MFILRAHGPNLLSLCLILDEGVSEFKAGCVNPAAHSRNVRSEFK